MILAAPSTSSLSHSSIFGDHAAAKALCIFIANTEIVIIRMRKTVSDSMLETDDDDNSIIVIATPLFYPPIIEFFRRKISIDFTGTSQYEILLQVIQFLL